MELLVFQLGTVATCPVAGHHQKEPGPIHFTLTLQTYASIDEIRLALLQPEQPQVSQLFLVREMLQALNNPCGPLLDSLEDSCLSCNGEHRAGHSTPDVATPGQSQGGG